MGGDRLKVDPEHRTAGTNSRGSNLQPGARGRPTINDSVSLSKDTALIIDLDQLVGGTGAIRLPLGLAKEVIVEFLHG